MKKIFKKIRNNWIAVWFIIAAFSLSMLAAYAIYTRITIAKRVVSTQSGASVLFSSSHMNNGGLKSVEPKTDNTQQALIPVYVYNYAYPKEAVYRSEDTEYDFTATLGILDANDNFTQLSDTSELSGLRYSVINNNNNDETFVFSSQNGTTHTFSDCSIQGGSADSNQFTLEFDKSELGNAGKGYCIKIEAVPYNTDLPELTGYIMVRYSRQASTGWKGELEALDENKSYDGFNYYLSGNGKGKLTFRWNPEKVTVNRDFLNNPNNSFYYIQGDDYVEYSSPPVESELTPDSNGMVSLIIEVDSSKQNRYEIQFFKIDPLFDYEPSAVEEYLPDTQPSDWKANRSSSDE